MIKYKCRLFDLKQPCLPKRAITSKKMVGDKSETTHPLFKLKPLSGTKVLAQNIRSKVYSSNLRPDIWNCIRTKLLQLPKIYQQIQRSENFSLQSTKTGNVTRKQDCIIYLCDTCVYHIPVEALVTQSQEMWL